MNNYCYLESLMTVKVVFCCFFPRRKADDKYHVFSLGNFLRFVPIKTPHTHANIFFLHF